LSLPCSGRRGGGGTSAPSSAYSRAKPRGAIMLDRTRTELGSAHAEAAERAQLAYVSDAEPGIRRKGAPKRFWYVGPTGEKLKEGKTVQRIRALAIPPAWTDVWISPDPNGHIQATGRD